MLSFGTCRFWPTNRGHTALTYKGQIAVEEHHVPIVRRLQAPGRQLHRTQQHEYLVCNTCSSCLCNSKRGHCSITVAAAAGGETSGQTASSPILDLNTSAAQAETNEPAQQFEGQGQQQQQFLEAASIKKYVVSNPTLRTLLGDPDQLEVEELLDGVINLVYLGQ
jgi:hypothetical protein